MSKPVSGNIGDRVLTEKESSLTANYQPGQMLHLHDLSTDFGIAFDAAPAADVKVIIFRANGNNRLYLVSHNRSHARGY